MTETALEIDALWKKFRMFHERNQYLKTALLKGRRTRFDDFWALKDISLVVPSGSTFGIVGSNGSGKSTLLKCIAGIVSPDSGGVRVRGRLAALLELGAGFHPELTGRENIYLNAAILGMTRRDITAQLAEIIEFSGLEGFIDLPVKNYSSGMVVRLGFAIAINVDPEVLLIDEVLAVGDESFQQRCYEKIENFRRDGRTIVLVSHGLSQVTQLCHTAAWIDRGILRRLGPALDVVSEYSGESHHAEPSTSDEIGERWGSMEAEIRTVSFVDENGFGKTPTTGSPLVIRVDYTVHSNLESLVVGMRITDLHGTNVWGTNTRRRAFPVTPTLGQNCIKYSVDRWPLLAGTYDITVALSDQSEVREYDHWERRIRFRVNQHSIYDEGITLLDGQWH